MNRAITERVLAFTWQIAQKNISHSSPKKGVEQRTNRPRLTGVLSTRGWGPWRGEVPEQRACCGSPGAWPGLQRRRSPASVPSSERSGRSEDYPPRPQTAALERGKTVSLFNRRPVMVGVLLLLVFSCCLLRLCCWLGSMLRTVCVPFNAAERIDTHSFQPQLPGFSFLIFVVVYSRVPTRTFSVPSFFFLATPTH